MNYYEVIPAKIFRTNSDVLTYECPENLPPGTLVLIPVGQKTLPGLIIKSVKKPNFPCKPITKILYQTPLPPHLIKSLLWLSTYYATPLPVVLQTALPRGIDKARRQKMQTFAARAAVEEGLLAPISSRTAAIAPRKDGRARERAPGSKEFDFLLNKAQLQALSKIATCKSNTILLHGITGSGKTNIYLELTRQQLAQNKSVVILIPEIALTSQIVKIFQTHFNNITLLHSEQTEAQRHLLWQNILEADEPQIIIGPRSALFAPVKNLGLVIIDEAHEPAYSQDQSPKYSALRLASTMSRTLLGTATPLITDYHLAQKNTALIELNELAIKSDKTTSIKIIDLKDKTHFKKHRLLSDDLLTSIENSLKNRTMSLLFHNRRGSAPLTLCDHCGWQALCPTCLLPLTLHNDKFSLLCHTCGVRAKIPTSCPKCHNANVLHKGFGTKYLESELTKLFPKTKIARFDADTPGESAMKNIYSEVKAGRFDIVIGTQMIAKGFDLPLLTTLGIVQADSQLSLPDYSSEERTYHLISQVIGRAHRGHQNSEIFVQTYQPDHPAIVTATISDYQTFYNHLLRQRRIASLPPYSYLLKLTMTYKTESVCVKNITKLRQEIEKMGNPRRAILGGSRRGAPEKNFAEIFSGEEAGRTQNTPATSPIFSISPVMPAFHERTPSGYTWQIIVKSKSRAPLLRLLKSLPQSPHLHFSLDPPSLL